MMPPGYPSADGQAFPQSPQPVYPMMPLQDLPPSPFPLQAPTPRNVLATLSIVVGVLAGALNYVFYYLYVESISSITLRTQEVAIYQTSALYHLLPLLVAGIAITCSIMALSYAKHHTWNGLIPALVGLVFSTYFLYSSLSFMVEFLIEANAIQNLIR